MDLKRESVGAVVAPDRFQSRKTVIFENEE